MPKFAIIKDEAASGSMQTFFKLYKNGVCLIDQFADSLTPQYRKHLLRCYHVLYELGEGKLPPGNKWHKLDSIYDLQEAKHPKGMRIYFFHQNGIGKIILNGSFQKTKQIQDIAEAENLIQSLPSNIEILKNDRELKQYIYECEQEKLQQKR